MCYFNPTQCTKNGENIAIDYKYQPLWAQTLKLLYMLDWWKKNCSEKCWNGMEFMGALSSHVCKYAPMGSISIPFPALFRAISFFFHQSNVYKSFRVWAHTGINLSFHISKEIWCGYANRYIFFCFFMN